MAFTEKDSLAWDQFLIKKVQCLEIAHIAVALEFESPRGWRFHLVQFQASLLGEHFNNVTPGLS